MRGSLKVKKINFKYTLIILAVFAFALIGAFCAVPSAQAEPEDFTVELKYDTSAIYEYNGNLYLSSTVTHGAAVKYVISNNTSDTVRFSAVRVTETLFGASYSYGNTTYDTEVIAIAPGESYEVQGEMFTFDEATDFVFQYNIFVVYYSEDEFGEQAEYSDADFVSILETDGIMYLTRETIALDVSYDYWMMQENIYVGDTVTVDFTATSSSNVPMRNIMVYDTVYGYIGQIDEINPGETKSFTAQITVTQSTVSSVYLTYTSLDGSQTLSRLNFEDKIIEINVTYHNYFLGMEIKCSEEYIGKGQTVTLEFIVTNVGSGRIENIAVLDDTNATLFTIPSLEPGEIYSETKEEVCNPGTTYKFRCISPQTEAVDAEISFSALPGVSLSYKLDKDADEYKYGDTIVIVYTITNNGSIPAENIILTDNGIKETWIIGTLDMGEQKSITYTYEITGAETVFSPNISGNYVDYDGETINETARSTHIEVELPDKYADIEMTFTHSPETIYVGDTVNFSFTFTNNGESPLMTYSVLVVEENMIIASEGKLDAGETRTFNALILCGENRRITVRIDGRNQNTGEQYTKDFKVNVEALPKIIVTPTPGPTEDVPSPSPTEPPHQTIDDNGLMLILVLVVGGIALVLVIITVIVLVKGVIKNVKKRK